MVKVTSIRGLTANDLCHELRLALEDEGFQVTYSNITSTSFKYKLRIDPAKRGYNVSPYTGRRGRILNWGDWVEANNIVNDVCDKADVSCNVRSSVVIIRVGKTRKTEADWEHKSGENVGSIMSPVSREDAWGKEW